MNIDLSIAENVIKTEADAVLYQLAHLDKQFVGAAELILKTKGRVVVIGLGKSGIIGKKIAATMASIGVPSVFLHPAECLHGDLGMIMKNDVVVMLSYSGETEEIKQLLPVLHKMKIKVIAMTGKINSSVWKKCAFIIDSGIKKEACPYNLAPTSSTTAVLALGDALAITVSQLKGFKKEHFAMLHPLGAIGNRVMKVSSIMRKGKYNPVVAETASVKDALLVMTGTRMGATSVVNKKGELVGFFTDGDLRRYIQKIPNMLSKKILEFMTKNPTTVSGDMLAMDAIQILKSKNIDNIPVVDKKNKPVGILDERDFLQEETDKD